MFIVKVTSKFDDHSDHESGTDTAHNSEQEEEEEEMYMDETPPESPVELRPELPPYLPAIQGCRNVEEFSCLNRIEEGTYGVVYRAKDKKTGRINCLHSTCDCSAHSMTNLTHFCPLSSNALLV